MSEERVSPRPAPHEPNKDMEITPFDSFEIACGQDFLDFLEPDHIAMQLTPVQIVERFRAWRMEIFKGLIGEPPSEKIDHRLRVVNGLTSGRMSGILRFLADALPKESITEKEKQESLRMGEIAGSFESVA